jgi:hypothetical protein
MCMVINARIVSKTVNSAASHLLNLLLVMPEDRKLIATEAFQPIDNHMPHNDQIEANLGKEELIQLGSI